MVGFCYFPKKSHFRHFNQIIFSFIYHSRFSMKMLNFNCNEAIWQDVVLLFFADAGPIVFTFCFKREWLSSKCFLFVEDTGRQFDNKVYKWWQRSKQINKEKHKCKGLYFENCIYVLLPCVLKYWDFVTLGRINTPISCRINFMVNFVFI